MSAYFAKNGDVVDRNPGDAKTKTKDGDVVDRNLGDVKTKTKNWRGRMLVSPLARTLGYV